MKRHFTVSGFVCAQGRTLLHWHSKLGIWLPAGGHIEPDEDPVEAALRETLEETGLRCEVVPGGRSFAFGEGYRPSFNFENVRQLPAPLSIIVADVPPSGREPAHQHIDFAYVLRPLAGEPADTPAPPFVWVSEAELRAGDPLPVASCGADIVPPDDVREVGLAAIALEREHAGR